MAVMGFTFRPGVVLLKAVRPNLSCLTCRRWQFLFRFGAFNCAKGLKGGQSSSRGTRVRRTNDQRYRVLNRQDPAMRRRSPAIAARYGAGMSSPAPTVIAAS